MENGLINGIVFIDLRNAFDMVDTDLLLYENLLFTNVIF